MIGARHALLILVGLALAAPSTVAQEIATEPTVTVSPLDGPIVPLAAARSTEIRVDMPCSAAGSAARPAEVHLWVVEAPEWLSISIAPVTYALDATSCQNGRVTHTSEMMLRAADVAPAFTPTTVQVGAAREGGATNVSAVGSLVVEVDFAPILDVRLVDAIQVARPGEKASFPLEVENRGNGRARFTFDLVDVTEGFEVQMPEPIILDSLFQSGSVATATVDIVVTASRSLGYNNEVGVVNVRLNAEDASGRGNATDESVVSLLITSKGLNASPAPWQLAGLGIVTAAFLLRRAQR